MFKNKKGFTLLEVTLTIALIGIISIIAYSIFNMSNKPHTIVSNEYIFQSNVRIASQKLTNIIKESTAIFAYKNIDPVFTSDIFPESTSSGNKIIIDENFINNSENKNDLSKAIGKYRGWSFITLSDDGKELREFIYKENPDTGKGYYVLQRILEKQKVGQNDIEYKIIYKKNKPYIEDNLLEYTIKAEVPNATNIEPFIINSEVEALNSLQVIEKGDYKEAAKVIFYRTDERPMGVDAEAAVAMVLDISGSMGEDMDGNTGAIDNANASNASRISILKAKATELVDKMAKVDNININLIPFSNKAYSNSISWWGEENLWIEYSLKPFYNANTQKDILNQIIDHLNASGGTNVGDGIRRAYYRLNEYDNKDANKYMILLMDGVPTFGSVYKTQASWIWSKSNNSKVIKKDGKDYYRSGITDIYNNTKYIYFSDIDFVKDARDVEDYWYDVGWLYGYYAYWSYNNMYPLNEKPINPIAFYAGPGSDSDPYISKPYITEMSKKLADIKNTKGEKNLKVFVIGFSNVPEEKEELEFITGELAKYTKQATSYDVTNAEGLEKVFNEINQIILEDLWHIIGPQE